MEVYGQTRCWDGVRVVSARSRGGLQHGHSIGVTGMQRQRREPEHTHNPDEMVKVTNEQAQGGSGSSERAARTSEPEEDGNEPEGEASFEGGHS